MKEKAAILFQKIYRGSRARKQYVLLKTYKKYEEEQYKGETFSDIDHLENEQNNEMSAQEERKR